MACAPRYLLPCAVPDPSDRSADHHMVFAQLRMAKGGHSVRRGKPRNPCHHPRRRAPIGVASSCMGPGGRSIRVRSGSCGVRDRDPSAIRLVGRGCVSSGERRLVHGGAGVACRLKRATSPRSISNRAARHRIKCPTDLLASEARREAAFHGAAAGHRPCLAQGRRVIRTVLATRHGPSTAHQSDRGTNPMRLDGNAQASILPGAEAFVTAIRRVSRVRGGPDAELEFGGPVRRLHDRVAGRRPRGARVKGKLSAKIQSRGWLIAIVSGISAACGARTDTDPTAGGALCPFRLSEVSSSGTPCPSALVGRVCEYPGTACPGNQGMTLAACVQHGNASVWALAFKPACGCPNPRPVEGAACDDTTMVCEYLGGFRCVCKTGGWHCGPVALTCHGGRPDLLQACAPPTEACSFPTCCGTVASYACAPSSAYPDQGWYTLIRLDPCPCE